MLDVSRQRADWRFLLDRPHGAPFEHLGLIGAPPSLADYFIRSNIAKRISTPLPTEPSCDAIAVLDLHDIKTDPLARALTPDGSLYLEFQQRTPFTARRFMHCLKNAGFHINAIYLVLPNFATAKKVLPLDSPTALRWYLDTFLIPATLLQKLALTVLRPLLRVAHPLISDMVPCIALTATLKPKTRAIPVPPTALITSGQDTSSRVILVPFASTPEPPTTSKLSPLPRFNAFTQHEHEILKCLHSRLDDSMRDTVPHPLSLESNAALALARESRAPGTSIWVSSGTWHLTQHTRMKDLSLATTWLTRFHQRAQLTKITWGKEAMAQRLGCILAEYDRIFRVNTHEENLFQQMTAQAFALDGAVVPIVLQHNDFGPWNLYRAGQEITVMDWESAREGLPLCDLIYFCTYWSFIVQKAHKTNAEHRAFADLWTHPSSANASHTAVYRAISNYLDALELDKQFLPLLLAHTWVERAVERHKRQNMVGTPAPDPRASNRFVEYVGLLAKQMGAMDLFLPVAPTPRR